MPEPSEDHGGESGRPFWYGVLAFGLVSIPVTLLEANRPAGIALHMVDTDGTPLSRRYLCSKDECHLQPEDIVRGYETETNQYVIVADEELEALAPEKSREIDLKRFVPLGQIEPIYFERAYFLAPDRGAVKAYRLLAETLETTGRAGIATFVMHGREYLVAILGEHGLLRAETLRFHDELRSPQVVGLPASRSADPERVKAMQQAIRKLSAESLDLEALENEQRRMLLALIGRKLKAGTDVIAAPEEAEADESQEGADVIDLMEVLKRSLQGEAVAGKSSARKPADKHLASPAPGKRQTSKDELYALARELGIEGRSHMSKKALTQAIGKADSRK